MKRLVFILMLTAFAACNPYDMDEILLPRDEVSLTIKGVEQFSFNPLTCQMSHNSTTNEFRAFDETLSSWFMVKCSDRPVNKGQEFSAELTWSTKSTTRTMKGLTFSIEKIDNSGQIWMWCRQKSIGIVIKNL